MTLREFLEREIRSIAELRLTSHAAMLDNSDNHRWLAELDALERDAKAWRERSNDGHSVVPLYLHPEAAVLAEREQCAQECDQIAKKAGDEADNSYQRGFADGAEHCAAAIRARGDK